MSFLAHADFSLPLNFISYFNEQFYTWSFNAGALNLDGVLRFLGRLPIIFFFLVSHSSVATAWFYILLIVAISFASFFWFLKYFLKSNNIYSNIILSLFFAINPVFLGNASKIGLVLGIAMLPLLLVSLKKYFDSNNLFYFILGVIALNVSLIHPFIFAVNFAVGGAYWLHEKYPKIKEVGFWTRLCKELLLLLGINAFILFTLFAIGTLDKSAIVNDLNTSGASVDSLLGYANTHGLVNAFGFSKDILKDFDFYNNTYESIYFASAFLLYIFFFATYLFSYRKSDFAHKQLFWLFGASLVIQLLATGSLLGVDKVLNFITQVPGGWAFRSPLKWQLYLPLFFFAAFGVLLKSLSGKTQILIAASLLVLFFSINSYIGFEVYENLLVPKHVEAMSGFETLPLENKTALLVGNENCTSLHDELNELLISKNVQVKEIPQTQIAQTYYQDFNYLISCRVLDVSGFELLGTASFKGFFVYENGKALPPIFFFGDLYTLNSADNLYTKSKFVSDEFDNHFYFANVNAENDLTYLTQIFAPFENLGLANISTPGVLLATTSIDVQKENTFYRTRNTFGSVTINGTPLPFAPKAPLTSPQVDNQITYRDPSFTFLNVIADGSFESGMWQKNVGDCHNYDKNPVIMMTLNTQVKSDGRQSLELDATRHTACTSGKAPVNAGVQYLFSFDYQSPNAAYASYYLGFNDKGKTIKSAKLPITDSNWHTFSATITAPAGATSVSLYVYSIESDGKTKVINRYDNFKLVEIPDLSNSYYLVGAPKQQLKNPASVTFDLINPTKKFVHIKGASTPFFLAMSESYHPDWQLELNDSNVQGVFSSWWPFVHPHAVASEYHYQLDGFLNAWYVDPAALCASAGASCVKHADGSYDIEMEIEFTPQRWFYLGLLVSGTTLLGCLGYLGYEGVKKVRAKK